MENTTLANGFSTLADLCAENAVEPSTFVTINLHRSYRAAPAGREEQIRFAIAAAEKMTDPTLYVRVARGNADGGWLELHGRADGIYVSVEMWLEDVCERRPEARRKRDRWVIPSELLAVAPLKR